jgi:hypothetical protein
MGRRKWTTEQKMEIVLAGMAPGAKYIDLQLPHLKADYMSLLNRGMIRLNQNEQKHYFMKNHLKLHYGHG